MFSKRRPLTFLLTLLSTLLFQSVAMGQSSNNTEEFADNSRYLVGEELIFSVRLDNLILGDYFVLVTKDGYAIEFDSLVSALDFPIKQDAKFVYDGWFISENNKFYADFTQSGDNISVTAGNNEVQIRRQDIVEHFGAVYVSTDAVESMFPLEFDFDETNLQVYLKPSLRLPVQDRLARESKSIGRRQFDSESQFPELQRYYELLSPQTLDVQLNATYSEFNDQLNDGYSIIGGREIAYLNSRFFLSGTSEDLVQSARLTLSRNFEPGSFMDYLGVSRFEAGDVSPVQIGTETFRGDTLGLILTNAPNERELNNQRSTTISGEVQSGWDVELYRNNVLIDRELSIEDGRYDFIDVDLFAGENNFRVVLYGPQGQEITREVNKFVDLTEFESDLQYRTSITKLGSSLFQTRNSSQVEGDVYDWSTQITKGLTSTTALNVGLRLQSSDDANNQAAVGLNTRLTDRLSLNLDAAFDDESNNEMSATLRGNYFGHTFNLSATTIDSETQTRESIALTNTGRFGLTDSYDLTYQNEVSAFSNELVDGIRWNNSIGLSTPIGLFNHSIEFFDRDISEQTLGNTNERTWRGSVNYRTRFGKVLTRAGLSYNDDVSLEIQNYFLDLSYSPIKDIRTRLSLSYETENELLFSRLDVGYESDWINVSANVSHSDDIGYRVGLSTRMSLGGEPFNRDIFYTNRGLSNTGTIMVRVFKDLNANAIFDGNDELMPDVTVESIQSIARGTTDSNGITTLQGLSISKKTDIRIVQESINEPLLKPIIEGVAILPRSGFVDSLDYPLVYSGELDGQVVIENDNRASLPPFQVELQNNRTKEIKTTRTEFDGYFYLADLSPGSYTLNIDGESLNRQGFRNIEPMQVSISPEGEFITVPEIKLSKLTIYRGFTVQLGQFKSLAMTKAFHSYLMMENTAVIRDYRAFYEFRDNEYLLNVGFFREKQTADLVCLSFSSADVDCAVKPIERREQ